jgi:hypothetical protein
LKEGLKRSLLFLYLKMPSMNSLLSFGESETHSQSSFDMEGICPSLSFKQRITGFAICFVGGLFIGFLATFLLFVSIVAFATLYTIGNLLSLSSTLFLMGPLRQIKSMFDPTRLFATIVFIAAMAMTLFCAFWFTGKNQHGIQVGLVILFLIIQFLALIWYSLSYIPFARTAVINCCRGLMR